MNVHQAYTPAGHNEVLGSLGVSTFAPLRHGGGFLNNNSPYVHELNRALQLEEVAISIYAAKQRNAFDRTQLRSMALYRTNQHFSAQRQLVRLIFAQSGLPDSDPASITAVTGSVAAKFSQFMPQAMQVSMLGASARRIEMALSRRYRQILKIAPASDRELIISLLEQANEFCL